MTGWILPGLPTLPMLSDLPSSGDLPPHAADAACAHLADHVSDELVERLGL